MLTKRPFLSTISSWLDNNALSDNTSQEAAHSIDYWRVIPFVAMHLACFALFWVGYSTFAIIFAVSLYAIRMFAITGFYHRYFSHKAFQTSRFGQFIFAVIGATAVQRGPLWWAAHHRNHHSHSDEENDAHSLYSTAFYGVILAGFYRATTSTPSLIE